MLVANKQVKTKKETKTKELFEKKNSKQKKNKMFIYIALSSEGFLSKDSLNYYLETRLRNQKLQN